MTGMQLILSAGHFFFYPVAVAVKLCSPDSLKCFAYFFLLVSHVHQIMKSFFLHVALFLYSTRLDLGKEHSGQMWY